MGSSPVLVKIRTELKAFIFFFIKQRVWKADIAAIIICKNNVAMLTAFAKNSNINVQQGSGYTKLSKFTRVLNMPRLQKLLIMSGYAWIIPRHDESAWFSDYARICVY